MLSRRCLVCKTVFNKSPSCSMAYWKTKKKFCSKPCWYKHRSTLPSPLKGRRAPIGSQGGKLTPCRICGKPTPYRLAKNMIGKVHCGTEVCRAASKAICTQHKTIALRAKQASGTWIRHGWENVPRVAKEEVLLMDWMLENGWASQHLLLTKGTLAAKSKFFILDFAHIKRKLAVEIDGGTHNNETRRAKDALKDAFLAVKGWRILRLPAKGVLRDKDGAIIAITSFMRLSKPA